MKKIVTLFILISYMSFVCAQKPDTTANVVYINAKIYTEDPSNPLAEAISVRNGRFVYVGSNEGVKACVNDNTKVVDLAGKVMLPSFIDSHTHPGLIAVSHGDDDLTGVNIPNGSKEELIAFLRKYAKDNPKKKFIMLGEWDVRLFGPKGPDRKILDEIFPNAYVLLLDSSGHSYWVNSKLLKALGINNDTPDMKKNLSFFVRDENGRMTGWVKEFALLPYLKALFDTRPKKLEKVLVKFLDFLQSRGVNTLLDCGTFHFENAVYKTLDKMEKKGTLTLRYEGTHHVYDPKQLKTAVKDLLKLKKKYESNLLKINTLKIHFDGVNEINTAAVLEPYENDPNNRGAVLFDEKELGQLMYELAQNKLNLHLHTVGDRSVRIALDALEIASNKYGGKLPIEITCSHLELADPKDIARFKSLGVHANFTPHWLGGTVFKGGDVALGKGRMTRNQQVNSFIKAGANVTFSSDVVTGIESHRASPFKGIQMGATRQESDHGKEAKIFGDKKERVSVDNMIKGYTINNAVQMNLENDLGSITVGKLADFVIINEDIKNIDVYEIGKIIPESVYMEGKKVYSNK